MVAELKEVVDEFIEELENKESEIENKDSLIVEKDLNINKLFELIKKILDLEKEKDKEKDNSFLEIIKFIIDENKLLNKGIDYVIIFNETIKNELAKIVLEYIEENQNLKDKIKTLQNEIATLKDKIKNLEDENQTLKDKNDDSK